MVKQQKRNILPALLVGFVVLAGCGWGVHAFLSSESAPIPAPFSEPVVAPIAESKTAASSSSLVENPVGQASAVADALAAAERTVTPGAPLPAEAPVMEPPVAVQNTGVPVPPPGAPMNENLGGDDTSTAGMLMPPVVETAVEGSSPQASPRVSGREDGVVRMMFVDDLAAFLVRNYWPRGTHPSAVRTGISTVSVQWANLRYGAEMSGIQGGDGSPVQARASVLRYVLNPATINSIYALYADRFVVSLQARAGTRTVESSGRKRLLTGAEKKEMLTLYAAYARSLGNALKRYTADQSMPAKVRAYKKAAESVDAARRAYLERVDAYETLQHGGGRQQAARARSAVELAAGVYQESIRKREEAKRTLITAMGGDKDSDESLVYIASWAERRGAEKSAALAACGDVALNMATRLRNASR